MKTQKDLSPQQKQTWLKAVSAMELRNYAYAIQICQNLLLQVPDFLDARKLARRAAREKTKTVKKGFFSGITGGSQISIMKASGLLKKNDIAALLPAIEEILADEPDNVQANMLLQEAAMKSDPPMKELAIFAFETIIEGNPKDKNQLYRYATFCMERDNGIPRNPTRAVEIYNRILAIDPNDIVAVKGSKDAAAAQSVQQGGWEVAESYRDLIKDKDQAVALEQQSRVVKSEEMIDSQIMDLTAQVEAEPQSIDKSRRVAELYEKKGDYENSILWYQYALGLSGGADPSIVRKVSDLQLRQIESAFKAREEYLATASPDDPEVPRLREEMKELEKQRADFILSEARDRVERNPTDLIAHYELAMALMDAGLPQEAIGHLQRARSNPSVRLKAMGKLGQCYVARNMKDLAAKTFVDAIAELLTMDAVKKEMLYNLGEVYESMGEKEKALDCFKQIYEVDYGYRDVAGRVEASYAKS